MKPMVIDISHHNTIPQSLEAAAASGIVGVIHKITEGTSFIDDKVVARRKLALDAGLCWGLYHFIRPGHIDEQAEFFLTTARKLEVEDAATLYVLDWEDDGVSLDDALEFLRMVEDVTGRTPVVYSGHILKEALDGEADDRLSRYPLWLAQYSSEPDLPPGWDDYWLWQYTENGQCPGVDPPVDLNHYDGTADQLRTEWRGSDVGPGPEPPEEPAVMITVVVHGIRSENVSVSIVDDDDGD